jgi:N-acetylglucosaminyl-diphospho-decaprenol L-rhamnosyltransferase
MIDLSIIIVTFNSGKDIGACLDSIERAKDSLDIEIIVVDNASKDNTLAIINSINSQKKLISNACNAGFPRANNQAIALAKGKHIMLLNPDTIVMPGSLRALVSFMDENSQCGVCGPHLVRENGEVYGDLRPPSLSFYFLSVFGIRGLLRKYVPAKNLEVVQGSCLVFRQNLISEVGLLDENLFWCEDMDFCYRLKRKGYDVCKVSAAQVIHLSGSSARANTELVIEKQYLSKIKYFQKHKTRIETKIAISLFIFQAAMRYMKWLSIGIAHPSQDAGVRSKTFERLISEMFVLLWQRHHN